MSRASATALTAALALFACTPAPKGPELPPSIPDEQRWAITLDPQSPGLGAGADALVTLVLFEDLASPFSRHFHPTLARLMRAAEPYLRVSYRFLPLPHNAEALPQAHAAYCAHEQGAFWAMRDALFKEGSKGPTETASALGLNLDTYQACLDSKRPSARIISDRLMARQGSVGGTPVLFINGRKSAGALPFEALMGLVERERRDAEVRQAREDTQREGEPLYEAIIAQGRDHRPLAEQRTLVSETPVLSLGERGATILLQAWLDLSVEGQRQSLKALMDVARSHADVSLDLFPAANPGSEHGAKWARALWCAKEGKGALALLEAASAATPHTHGHPMKQVVHDAEEHPPGEALEDALRLTGVTMEGCPPNTPEASAQPTPTWLINGRRYTGSLGFGPPALRHLLSRIRAEGDGSQDP